MTNNERNGPSNACRRCRVDAATLPHCPVRCHPPSPPLRRRSARLLASVLASSVSPTCTLGTFGEIGVTWTEAGWYCHPRHPHHPSPQRLLVTPAHSVHGVETLDEGTVTPWERNARHATIYHTVQNAHSLKLTNCCFWNFPFNLSGD